MGGGSPRHLRSALDCDACCPSLRWVGRIVTFWGVGSLSSVRYFWLSVRFLAQSALGPGSSQRRKEPFSDIC